MNDAPSLKDSLARWTGFPKLERRFEPRRSRAAKAQVTRRLGDIEPKAPEPYDLKALYRRVMESWRRHESLEGVSSRDLQRLPWVLFYEPRERRRTRQQGPAGWLGGKPRVVHDYRRWLSRTRRARPVQALLHEFLRVYPTDLSTFDDLREMLQVSVMGNSSSPPSLRKWRQRCLDFQLLGTDDGIGFMRKLMTADEDTGNILTHAGFDAGLARCGFLKSGIRKFLPSISPQLARNRIAISDLDRVLALLECEGKLRFDEPLVRVEVASALLQPFVDRPPNSATRERLQSFFVRHFGHPNLRSRKHKWAGVSDDVRRVVIRWLVERVLDQFFLLIKETALDLHWRYREAFWKTYLRKGLIDDIWFLLGTRAEDHLRNINRKDALTETTGRLHHAGGDQSVLLLRMPGVTIAEWSHNGSCRCWLDGNQNAPKLYQKEYSRHTLIQGSDFAQPHFGSERGYWQARVAKWIRDNIGATVSPRRRSQRPRTRGGSFPVSPAYAGLSTSLNDPERQWTAMATPKAKVPTLAGLMDEEMFSSKGVTFKTLLKLMEEHSEKHGLKTKVTLGLLKAHARFRAKNPGVTLEMDDKWVRLIRLDQRGSRSERSGK